MRRNFALLLLALLACAACRESHSARGSRCDFNTVVSFAADGDAARIRGSGWAQQDPAFTWTTGSGAKLEWTLPPSARPIGIRMRLAGLVKKPELPIQTVFVSANGEQLAEWHVAKEDHFFAVIPRERVGEDGKVELSLTTPSATSPKALGLGEDERVLGVRCYELEISRAADLPLRAQKAKLPAISSGP